MSARTVCCRKTLRTFAAFDTSKQRDLKSMPEHFILGSTNTFLVYSVYTAWSARTVMDVRVSVVSCQMSSYQLLSLSSTPVPSPPCLSSSCSGGSYRDLDDLGLSQIHDLHLRERRERGKRGENIYNIPQSVVDWFSNTCSKMKYIAVLQSCTVIILPFLYLG